MRMLIRIVSVLGAIVFLILAALALGIGSVSDGAGGAGGSVPAGLAMLCPLIYFAICFWTSFARRRQKRVLLAGLTAHFCLAVFVVAAFYAGDIGGVFLIAAIVCTGLWTGMYLSLERVAASAPELSG
jgi:membrane protease YdiL (CAAX protease family)